MGADFTCCKSLVRKPSLLLGDMRDQGLMCEVKCKKDGERERSESSIIYIMRISSYLERLTTFMSFLVAS